MLTFGTRVEILDSGTTLTGQKGRVVGGRRGVFKIELEKKDLVNVDTVEIAKSLLKVISRDADERVAMVLMPPHELARAMLGTEADLEAAVTAAVSSYRGLVQWRLDAGLALLDYGCDRDAYQIDRMHRRFDIGFARTSRARARAVA